MSRERIFGTDGVRGRAGEGWLTAGGVSALGRAIGTVLGARDERPGARRALLAHDGRRSGPELQTAVAQGLADAGFESTSAGLITTPGLAMLTRLGEFRLGVMISASHNPAEDNGVKVFGPDGDKLSDDDELQIEAWLRGHADPVGEGPAPRLVPELELRYLTYLTEEAAPGLRLDGMSLVVDCANGGGSRIAPRVFGRLGAQVKAIAAEPDGSNINLECGATSPAALQKEVCARGAAIGVALDGDGDRCLLVDERGELVHGDGIMTIIARQASANGRRGCGPVVATVMSNRGLHRALREVGVQVVTVGVGDRRVVEGLRREGGVLGGEQSGHIVFGGDNAYIGDGLYTALRVLSVMRETGRPLSELAASYRPFPQVLVNVPVKRQPDLSQLPRVVEAVRRFEEELGEDGRVLLRYSGTEPLARVMVEGPDSDRIQDQARQIAELLSAEIGLEP